MAGKWSATTPSNRTPDERCYLYSYDKLYRLTASTYKARGYGSSTFNKETNGYNESFTYDWNGNILSLQRKAWLSGSATSIDDLTYSYKNSDKDNQLDNITEPTTGSLASYGWVNSASSSSAYTYDDNGNLATDPKKGTTITYNELNKPTLVQKSSTKKIAYYYDASGVRISKWVYDGSSTVPAHKYEYVGGYVYLDGDLSYYGMSEGRVRNDGGTGHYSLKLEYFISDHQGNVRVSFEDNGSGTAVVKQENSYYAFGMIMPGGYTPTDPNKHLYNAGSEWQDDISGVADYYSTFFREYDPITGRFNSVDPMSEAFESWSTYHYCYNNPVNLNDPTGAYVGIVKANRADREGHLYEYSTADMAAEMQNSYGLWHSRYNNDWSNYTGVGGELGGGGGRNFRIGNEDKWPTKGMEVHQQAIDNYYDDIKKGKSKAEIDLIKKKIGILKTAELKADENQNGEVSYTHAMRNETQTPEEAKKLADQYVREKFMKAKQLFAEGKVEEAYALFGLALHTLQDATSPAHNGFQLWTGKETEWEKFRHNLSESFFPGINSNLQKITNLAIEWFEKLNTPLPSENLFNGIKADHITD